MGIRRISWWLQKVEGLELRRDNKYFLEYTDKYINRLYQEVGNLQITKGGPIIMVQVENEFGSYAPKGQTSRWMNIEVII